MDRITNAAADDLERKYAAKKRAKRLNKPVDEDELPEDADTSYFGLPASLTGTPKKKTTGKKAAAPSKKAATKTKALPVPPPPDPWYEQAYDAATEYVPGMGHDGGGGGAQSDEEAYKEYEKMVQKAAAGAHKINMYYELFPATSPGGKRQHMWTGDDDPMQIDIELARCAQVVNSMHAPRSVRDAVGYTAYGLEYTLMDWGYNPMQLQLRGFTKVVEGAMNEPDMQDDMNQLAIEYNEWLSSGPVRRLVAKVFQLAVMTHQVNTLGGRLPAAAAAAAPAAQESGTTRKRAGLYFFFFYCGQSASRHTHKALLPGQEEAEWDHSSTHFRGQICGQSVCVSVHHQPRSFFKKHSAGGAVVCKRKTRRKRHEKKKKKFT